MEHCRSVPISLWGFQVSESALNTYGRWKGLVIATQVMNLITHLSIPLNFSALYFRLIMRPPPQAAFKGRGDVGVYVSYQIIISYTLPNVST